MKYSFANDYSEGCAAKVLDALIESNAVQTCGYGLDGYCEEARKTIQKLIKCEEADVHFLVGGTQTNLTVIAAALRPYEAVIAVDSGHIHVHETGAIEACGHKVIAVKGNDGKLEVEAVKSVLDVHIDEHMVKPKMLYISNATEIGTIYKKAELQALRQFCDQNDLYLFLDGARLGCALNAEGNDLCFADLAALCDVFYIGGTKNGALFGEAVVIVNEALKADFRYMIKLRGGMLAKGRLLGVQFLILLKDGLYAELAKHANETAQHLQKGMKELGCQLLLESPTNQVFAALSHEEAKRLSQNYTFNHWEKIDACCDYYRFVTSWATPIEAVDGLLEELKRIKEEIACGL